MQKLTKSETARLRRLISLPKEQFEKEILNGIFIFNNSVITENDKGTTEAKSSVVTPDSILAELKSNQAKK